MNTPGPIIVTSVMSKFRVSNLNPINDVEDMSVFAYISVEYTRTFRWIWVNTEPDVGSMHIVVVPS